MTAADPQPKPAPEQAAEPQPGARPDPAPEAVESAETVESAEARDNRLRRAASYAAARRQQFVDSRGRYRPVDVVMSVSEHDLALGGSLLAGALAFRLFLWSLPASLVLAGLAGFRPDTAEQDARAIGLPEATVLAIGEAAEQAQGSRWLAVIIGLVLLYGVSVALARALVTGTALLWRIPVAKLRRPWRVAPITTGVMLLGLLASVMSGWVRANSPGLGLATVMFLGVLWGFGWWLTAAFLLPRPAHLPWWGLIPGAVLVGIGLQAMHLVGVFYLGPKINSASHLYGSLGIAATMLLATYLISRLVLASTTVNLVVLTVYGRHPADQPDSPA